MLSALSCSWARSFGVRKRADQPENPLDLRLNADIAIRQMIPVGEMVKERRRSYVQIAKASSVADLSLGARLVKGPHFCVVHSWRLPCVL
jgi:hypothetical protein